jgi:AraC family transcriptional regulator, regulatory protein of adaptative response / DNA-3-methyladenine glycosylase II
MVTSAVGYRGPMKTGVSAVRTTGIYCRAVGCPASPNKENVVDYSSAVAAEAAGYRPCLRCRPDRSPPVLSANGASGPIANALLLIGEGALDSSTEEELGRRVGLSARQLRRLFLEYVGATPAFVARSRRAHFARRLLDESDLSITDIAYAAGFRSVRQMNRVMVDTFRFSPSTLREKRRERDRLTADGGLPLRAPYEQPFDLAAMLRFLGPRAIAGLEAVEATSYRRTITTCGHPGAIEVSDAGDRKHLVVLAHLPTFNSLIDDVARVRRIFGLDQPAAARLPALSKDPLIGPLVAANRGLRLAGAWDRFESAVRIVLTQQISLRAARTILGRLVRTFGTPVDGLSKIGLTHTFPSAERLASASVAKLSSVGIPSTRAATLKWLATLYASEALSLEPTTSLDDLVARLAAIPGVGPWTAHCIALRSVGHADAFPADDLGLRRAAGRAKGTTELLDSSELLELAEAWRPYRGLAAMHLWASL